MTDTQLYFAVGLPILANILTSGVLYLLVASLRREMTAQFAAVNQRFDDMRDLWRAELGRVEEVLDARLKALEEHYRR